jgi:hypothetical protein
VGNEVQARTQHVRDAFATAYGGRINPTGN